MKGLEQGTFSVLQEEIKLKRPKGDLPVYIAYPDSNQAHPAVIIVHEIFGLDEHIKSIANQFASSGIVAYAPDLFAYASNLPQDRTCLASMRTVWESLPDEQFILDLQAVYELAEHSKKVASNAIGTLGYCMGGAIAFMFACRTPSIAWVVDYYGRIFYPQLNANKKKHPIDYIEELKCPVLGIFAGQDQLITSDHIKAFKDKLASSNKNFQIKVYPDAQHAFCNDTREFYSKEAAQDAWQITLDFIKKNSSG